MPIKAGTTEVKHTSWVFIFIFLLSLGLLSATHYFQIANHEVFLWVIIFSFTLAIAAFVLGRFRLCFFLLAFSIAFLISGQFVKEKEAFNRTCELEQVLPRNTYITATGVLSGFPEIRRDSSVIVLAVDTLEFNRKRLQPAFNVRIRVSGDLSHLFRGDRISIDARIYSNTPNINFFTNPFEDYRLIKKLHFNGYCKSDQLITLKKRTHWAWALIGKWRNSIRRAIQEKYSNAGGKKGALGDIHQNGMLLQAILIGERGKLTNQGKESLIKAGVFHLLAISGAHIGIIALGCLLILRWLKVPFKIRYVICALILVLFLVLSGFKLSAERAVFMALLIFLAKLLYLQVDIYNIISFCGLLLLARNPAGFMDAGFILTFSLTAAIVMGRGVFLELFKKIRWEYFKEKIFIKELLSANLSASLAALPLSLFFFRRSSFSGIFSGLLLAPLMAVIIGLGFLLIPLSPISPFLSSAVLWVVDLPVTLFFYITGFFSETVQLSIYRASPSIIVVLLVLASFYFLSVSRKRLHKIIFASVVVLSCLFISLNIFFYRPSKLEVFYLDIGQGDAQVVVFPGGDALLIDGGGLVYSDFEVGKNILLPFILDKRINIKYIAVTHYDADHVKGIIEIIDILNPEELWLSARTPESGLYNRLLAATPGTTRIRYLAAPHREIIKGCKVQWLFPVRVIEAGKSRNNHSQVLKISDGHTSFLFTGDLERGGELQMADSLCNELKADVLKVPHHGSGTSSTLSFLKCISPGLAIFSYARFNRFGFPHPRVIRNYKQMGIPYMSTAHRGGIHIKSGIIINTSK